MVFWAEIFTTYGREAEGSSILLLLLLLLLLVSAIMGAPHIKVGNSNNSAIIAALCAMIGGVALRCVALRCVV